MIFARESRSFSRQFLLISLISAAHGFAADKKVGKAPEKLAKMPTIHECINGGHENVKVGFKKRLEKLCSSCENENQSKAFVNKNKALGPIQAFMFATVTPSLKNNTTQATTKTISTQAEELMRTIRRKCITQDTTSSEIWNEPQRNAVAALDAIHHNVNFTRLFLMLGGHAAEDEMLDALSRCSSKKIDDSVEGLGEDPAAVLPPYTANLDLYIAATRLVAESLPGNKEKFDLNEDSSEIVMVDNETIIKSLEKMRDLNKPGKNEEELKKYKIHTIISSALIHRLEQRTDETLKAENRTLQQAKTALESRLLEQTEETAKLLDKKTEDHNVLVDEHKQLTQELARRSELAANIDTEKANLAQQLTALQKKDADDQRKLTVAEADLKKARQDHTDLAGKYVQLTDTNNKLTTDAATNKTTITTLTQQLTTLQEQLKKTAQNPQLNQNKGDQLPQSHWSWRSLLAGGVVGSLFGGPIVTLGIWKAGFFAYLVKSSWIAALLAV